jgi:hypothetical protein
LGETHPFGISAADDSHHIYIIGKTGSGKTTLLRNMLTEHTALGRGVALIDPHGDLAEELLHHIPPNGLTTWSWSISTPAISTSLPAQPGRECAGGGTVQKEQAGSKWLNKEFAPHAHCAVNALRPNRDVAFKDSMSKPKWMPRGGSLVQKRRSLIASGGVI